MGQSHNMSSMTASTRPFNFNGLDWYGTLTASNYHFHILCNYRTALSAPRQALGSYQYRGLYKHSHISFKSSHGLYEYSHCLINTLTASTSCARDNLRVQKSLGPLKMSLEMAQKVIVPQKKLCPAVS
jgi:hypothetical protein